MNIHARKVAPVRVPKAADHVVAVVSAASATDCQLLIDGQLYTAAIATHILCLVPGQQVIAIDNGAAGWLVVAAWPTLGQTVQPLHFDPASGTLSIRAARLHLDSLSVIDLQCGEVRLRLSIDGRAHLEAQEIVSAAVGSNRIEGASIDLN